MNTIETQKNAFDMLSEKQQNSKQYVHHYQEHGAVEEARAQNRQNQVLILTASEELGDHKPVSTPF